MNRFIYWPRLLSLFFFTGSVLALFALGMETNWGTQVRGQHKLPTLQPASAPSIAVVPPFTLPELDAGYPESAARPLFMPTRRPVPAAAPAPVIKRGQFVLVGTSRTVDFGDSVMLKESPSGKTHVVRVGQTIQDMTVKSIGPDRVVLAVGDETEEIVMRASNSPRQPPIAVGEAGPFGRGAAASTPGAGQMPGPGSTSSRPAATNPAPGQGAIPAQQAPVQPPARPALPQTPPQPADAGARQSAFEEILERRRRARAQQAEQPKQSP